MTITGVFSAIFCQLLRCYFRPLAAGIEFRFAFPVTALGVIIAGILVTLASMSVIALWRI